MSTTPITYFGNKRKIAPIIWKNIGNVDKFIDCFGGSMSVLLARPHSLTPQQHEIVNDLDGRLVNFYRAMKYDPVGLAKGARNVMRASIEAWARAAELKSNGENLIAKLSGSSVYYDIELAISYVYINSVQIGKSFVMGAWGIDEKQEFRKLYVGMDNRGVQRCRVSVRHSVYWNMSEDSHVKYYQWLSNRLMRVTILCGEWDTPLSSFTAIAGKGDRNGDWSTGIILDPPYAGDDHDIKLYENHNLSVSPAVRKKAIELGEDKRYKVVLCGYIEEHEAGIPSDWHRVSWTADAGYASQNKRRDNKNRKKEMLWFSPGCNIVTETEKRKNKQLKLF